jgi:23S rRNA (uracil1939-C5)-methyltransferase
LEGRAGQFADFYDEHDVVIVDPPRKGLDAELLTRLLRVAPQRLIYLSCGLPALLRECEALHRTQNYRLEHVSAWGYFPYTEHVETLMVFGAVASGAVSDGEKLRPANPKIEPGAPSM